MTHEDIVNDRGVRLINYAAEIGNLAEARRSGHFSVRVGYGQADVTSATAG